MLDRAAADPLDLVGARLVDRAVNEVAVGRRLVETAAAAAAAAAAASRHPARQKRRAWVAAPARSCRGRKYLIMQSRIRV